MLSLKSITLFVLVALQISVNSVNGGGANPAFATNSMTPQLCAGIQYICFFNCDNGAPADCFQSCIDIYNFCSCGATGSCVSSSDGTSSGYKSTFTDTTTCENDYQIVTGVLDQKAEGQTFVCSDNCAINKTYSCSVHGSNYQAAGLISQMAYPGTNEPLSAFCPSCNYTAPPCPSLVPVTSTVTATVTNTETNTVTATVTNTETNTVTATVTNTATVTVTNTVPTTLISTTTATSLTSGLCVTKASYCYSLYSQCGGSNFNPNPLPCCCGSTCIRSNAYYSQCL